MKTYLNLLFLFLVFPFYAQTINFNDQVFKQRLLQANSGNFIAQNLNGDYVAIDSNNNSQIEVSEALAIGNLNIQEAGINNINEISNFTNLIGLNCSNNNLQNLNISSNSQLTNLNCSNNAIQFLNLSNATLLEVLDCSFNSITTINLNSCASLIQLNCSNNNLTAINNLTAAVQLVTFNCNNNQLSQLDLINLVELKFFDCSYNNISAINCSANGQLINLRIDHNSLSLLSLINLNQLVLLDCSYNNLNQLVLQNLNNLNVLNFQHNVLTNVSFFGLSAIQNLDCSNNQLIEMNTNDFPNLLNLNCSTNNIQSLNLSNNGSLFTLIAHHNQITSLDCSSNASITTIEIQNNFLTQLNIKNGSIENLINFSNNGTLAYICCDYSESNLLQFLLSFYNVQNCILNDFCQSPQNYSTLTINNRVDSNNNTQCDTTDSSFPYIKLRVSDSNSETIYFSNDSGIFIEQLPPNYYLVVPEIQNVNDFNYSPSILTVDFPANNPYVNSFCFGHQTNSNDLELVVFPVTSTSNSLTIGLVIKNNGNTNANGIIELTFASNYLSFVNSSIAVNGAAPGILSWNFQNCKSGEFRYIQVTFQHNGGLPSNGLSFTGTVTPSAATDIFPNDNTFTLIHNGSNLLPLEVLGLQGDTISIANLQAYHYYAVTYTNTSGQPLNQLTIQIPIANSDYEIGTFWPVYSNYAVTSRMSNSSIELFFRNINLAVNQKITFIFKIKSLQNLPIGTQISMVANAYVAPSTIGATAQFDSIIQALSALPFDALPISIFPNPCKDFLFIEGAEFMPTDYEIIDLNGKIIQSNTIENKMIPTSSLQNGIYFIRFSDGKFIATKKLIKYN
jgi:Leucine-rich repeat (LRR) protein